MPFPDATTELAKLAAANGYEITATGVDEAGKPASLIIGQKGDSGWYYSGAEGIGYSSGKYQQENVTHIFYKENTWSYQYAIIDAEDFLKAGFGSIYSIFALNDEETKAILASSSYTRTTLNGFNVLKYSINYEGQTGDVYVETQYGICVKVVSSETNFEVTKIEKSGTSPFANVQIPDDFDVYEDMKAIYSGKPLNAPELQLSDKFYIKFQQYSVEDGEKKQLATFNLMKDGNNTLGYYASGNSTMVDQWDVKEDGSYEERQGQVYSGTGRAQWNRPADKTSEDFMSSLNYYLGAQTYLQYKKSANAVPEKDKVIAGVSCKAYEVTTGYGSIYSVEMKFWVDPNTNIIFYGYNKMIYGEETYETVNIDVLEYSSNLQNGYFDHSCESLIYREATTPQNTDTHHVQSEPGIVTVATCSEKGQTGTKCIYCGYKTVTGETEFDPENHSGKSDYWYDDGEGHHYHECYECGEKYDIGDHQLDESELKPTCSGKAELKCAICEREVEFDVEKSETHTYNIWHYDLSDYYINDPDQQVTVDWHCDCWYQDSWDREGEAGEDLVWNVPKLSNADYFTMKDKTYYVEYSANKEVLARDVKTLWPNESDETINEVLDEILYNMGFYNGVLYFY